MVPLRPGVIGGEFNPAMQIAVLVKLVVANELSLCVTSFITSLSVVTYLMSRLLRKRYSRLFSISIRSDSADMCRRK